MAFSLIVSASAQGNGNISDATTGAEDTSGATLIVLSGGVVVFSDVNAFSDSKGNTWTLLTAETPGGITLEERMAYCFNPNVGAGHTFTNSGSYAFIGMVAFSGSHATAPFDQESGDYNGSASTIQPGSLTPPEDDCLLVTGIAATGTDGFSINSSFTIAEQLSGIAATAVSGAIAYKIQTSAGAENPTWTYGDTQELGTTLATFKSTGGAGPSGQPIVKRFGGIPFMGGGLGNKGSGRSWI